MSFWPQDLEADDVRSPQEIMFEAGIELEEKTKKVVVSVQETVLPDRIVLAFCVFNNISKVTLNLFETTHQISEPYPVAIVVPEANIPEFLKKKRLIPGTPPINTVNMMWSPRMSGVLAGTPDRFIENKWVSSTPTEFVEKLRELFSEDFIKTRLVSLLATKSNNITDSSPKAAKAKPSDKGRTNPKA